MKTKRIYLFLVALSVITWGCTTQNDLSVKSLKTSITTNAQELSTAMDVITSSPGYQVLSTENVSSTTGASYVHQPYVIDSTYNSIMLSDISGIYDYQAANYKRWNPSLLNFFVRTGDSDHMIVRLPESKVKNPHYLLHYSAADTLLTNNYVIDLSDYQYKFNRYLGWDYQMASSISVSDTAAGTLQIKSSNDRTNGYNFSSEFAFANGYTTKTTYASGDTIVSSYSITKDAKTLFEEKYTATKSSTVPRHREREYSLTIGDVQIVRNSGPNSLDSAKVYVAGVLQTNAKVEIIDVTTTASDTTETCLTNHRRDIQITFDDGTVTTVSELLGSTIDNIRTLFVSLRQVYFATSVVDRIAWDVYINKQ